MKFATVITFCTIDRRFVNHCVRQAAKFSDEIICTFSPNLQDGRADNPEKLQAIIRENQGQTKFLAVSLQNEADKYGVSPVCGFRWAGFKALQTKPDWVLFLDADEIIDGDRFRQFLDVATLTECNAFSLRCYWYFRSANNQALKTENAGTAIRRTAMKPEYLFHRLERWGAAQAPLYVHDVCGLDGLPMCHHYSWVRTKQEMLDKVGGWGHCKDRDWTFSVEEEFKHDFAGRDFVHGYTYRILERPFVEVGL
jgi:hypothetical protein